ncbi:unnamed protein product [Lupinus luteus]|uniref:BZIP domain-containing protein n=1 Tax=Lupinus luteus TaxID=3873 RepID=A0AAV1XAI0_LUPLU
MGTEESNTFVTPYKLLVPQDGTLDETLPPHWTSSMQPFDNHGSTSTSLLNSDAAGLYIRNYTLPKEDFPSPKKQKCAVMLRNEDPGEQNQDLGTCLNPTTSISPQFFKLEDDAIRKERKRQSNRESAKRSRMRKQKECDDLHRNMDILKDENSKLTQMLMMLSEECMELTVENDSIQEELVEMYGPESIADLLPMKPASGGSQITVKGET